MRRRTYSIRTALTGSIILSVLVAYAGMIVLILITDFAFPTPDEWPTPPVDEQVRAALFTEVERSPDRWRDPAWLRSIEQRMADLHLGLTLQGPDGRLLYRSESAWSQVLYTPSNRLQATPAPSLRTVVIYQGKEEVGTVTWHDAWGGAQFAARERIRQIQNLLIPGGAMVIMALTVWGGVRPISRPILRPLTQLSRAAEQINRGELDFQVPDSPIREVSEFARAFDRMRAGLKDSLTRQAEMEQERRMFIAALAHDLRTPLTSVRGYLEGLRDGVADTPEKADRYVRVALEKTAALERLAESFFAFARTEYLNQPPQRQPIDLGRLLTSAVAGMRPQADAKGVALTIDEGPLPCTAHGDAQALSRVVDNLLDNALRHTPAGGTVTVGWRSGVERCRFWVADTGPGIPEADLTRIFEPTYRGDRARTSRTGGAGLGLAIARRLVEVHGGAIRAENALGGGARFTVTLPLAGDDPNAGPAPAPPPCAPDGPPPSR